jgi:CspA family cold shock protein
MNKGTVKFFNTAKGFGFIKDDQTKSEYFVHVTNLLEPIKQNDAVIYDLQEGKRGMNAVNVKQA